MTTSNPYLLLAASARRYGRSAMRFRRDPVQSILWVSLLMCACTDEGSSPAATPSATSTVTAPTVPSDTDSVRDVPSSVVSNTEPLFNEMPPGVQVSDASAEPDVSDARLQTCVPSKGPGEVLLIDDFEDGDDELVQREGRSGIWYQYEELSGDHQLTFEPLASPRLGSSGALHTSGTDHGEWAGVGVVLSGCVYDASSYVGVHFWIRGDSAPVNVALVTPGVIPVSNGGTCTKEEEGLCYDAYRSPVDVSGQWREVFLPFTSFEQLGYGPDAGPLDLTRLESIQFQSNSSAFDLWIDDVSFYVEEVYTPYEAGIPTTEPSTTSEPATSTPNTSMGPNTSWASSESGTNTADASTVDGGNP